MLKPPTNLILEIPSQLGDVCPVECRHCIHRNGLPSIEPKLSIDQIKDLILQGQALGIEYVNIYPHQGDLTLEPPDEPIEFFRYAHTLGIKTKTVTLGISPQGLEMFLPFLSRLALSVDALDKPTYVKLRTVKNYNALMESIELLKGYRKSSPGIFITALVMVNLLPIGGARRLKKQALAKKSDLKRLAMIKQYYQSQGLRVGVPLWRIENDRRGCQLGGKDMVVGPRGELAGCTLMFYLNKKSGNVHTVSLAEAWQENFSWFREKSQRPVAKICLAYPFFHADLCWGGCLARGLIFGREVEVHRACGVCTPDDAWRLNQEYLQTLQQDTPGLFPLNIEPSME